MTLTAAGGAFASSHREAPSISNDPAADHTDLYAWVDPTSPSKVNILVSVSPMQDPAGGPNFWRFDPSVRYEIHIDNDRDARPDVTYRFQFSTFVANKQSFLYANGPVTGLNDANLNVRQSYRVTKIREGGSVQFSVGGLRTLPANVGPRSTPDYEDLVDNAVQHAATSSEIRLELRPGALTVAVRDGSPRPAMLHERTGVDRRGNGLRIVADTTRTWGCSPHLSGGKVVWAVLRLS